MDVVILVLSLFHLKIICTTNNNPLSAPTGHKTYMKRFCEAAKI